VLYRPLLGPVVVTPAVQVQMQAQTRLWAAGGVGRQQVTSCRGASGDGVVVASRVVSG
jgi:hypothetical protein